MDEKTIRAEAEKIEDALIDVPAWRSKEIKDAIVTICLRVRESDAKMCDAIHARYKDLADASEGMFFDGAEQGAEECAAAIRSQGDES